MLHNFDYFSSTSIDKVLEHLDKDPENSVVLAGGTDLLVNMRNNVCKPKNVIDIKKIDELHKISFDKDKGLVIGACVTCFEALSNSTIKKHFSFLAEAAGQVGSVQLRNRATLAGNLCTASPCGDVSRALLCLDAQLEVVSVNGNRMIRLSEFFTGVKRNALEKNEIVTAIHVSADMADKPGAHEKLKRIKGHDLAVVSLSILKTGKTVRMVGGSCAPVPALAVIEKAEPSVEEVIEASVKAACPVDDIRATAEYRKFMLAKFARKIMQKLNNSKDKE